MKNSKILVDETEIRKGISSREFNKKEIMKDIEESLNRVENIEGYMFIFTGKDGLTGMLTKSDNETLDRLLIAIFSGLYNNFEEEGIDEAIKDAVKKAKMVVNETEENSNEDEINNLFNQIIDKLRGK